MNQTDFSKFSEMLDLVAEMYGKATKPNQVAMWFRILSAHSLESVQAAFDALPAAGGLLTMVGVAIITLRRPKLAETQH